MSLLEPGSLAPGPHSLAVRGRDAAGNVGQPDNASWTIVPPALPDLAVAAFESFSITVVNRGTPRAPAPS